MLLIVGKVVGGYRLSWSCMQLVVLAYVSTGSFISHTGHPCRPHPPGQVTKGTVPTSPRLGGPDCRAAMPKECMSMIMV